MPLWTGKVELTTKHLDAFPEPDQARAAPGGGAADSVIANGHLKTSAYEVCSHVDLGCVRVLDRIGQRFHDDKVDRDFRRLPGESPDRQGQNTSRQYRRIQSVGQLTQFAAEGAQSVTTCDDSRCSSRTPTPQVTAESPGPCRHTMW